PLSGRSASPRPTWSGAGTARMPVSPAWPSGSTSWPFPGAARERFVHPRRLPRAVRPARPGAGDAPRLEMPVPGPEPLELSDADARDAPGRRAAPDAADGRAPDGRGDPLAADLRPVPGSVSLGLRSPAGQAADP